MTIQTLWKITRRWWWLALIPAVLVGGLGLATYQTPPTTYGSTVRLAVGLPPVESDVPGFDPLYYSWLTSEYIVGSLSDWIGTGEFAAAVSTELARSEIELPPPAVQGALASDYVRSTLVLYVNGGDPDQVAAIASAAITVLQTENAAVFPQLGGQNATVTALDTPQVGANPPGLRSYLTLVIRAGLGLAVGVLLAFGAWYFDPYLREPEEVERLEWPLLGEIPRE